MCELYVKADPILYESRSRSVRVHGCVTKIRLENLFWDILAELAASDGYTTNQLIAKLYDELLDYRGEIENFASFLRVSCLRYLTLKKGVGDRPVLAVVGKISSRAKPGTYAAAPDSSLLNSVARISSDRGKASASSIKLAPGTTLPTS